MNELQPLQDVIDIPEANSEEADTFSVTFNFVTFSTISQQQENLLVTAINNRTRELNYFKKYVELLQHRITDEEFDQLMEQHSDDFSPEQGKPADINTIRYARYLSDKLIDVNDVNDMADLFSISMDSIQPLLDNK